MSRRRASFGAIAAACAACVLLAGCESPGHLRRAPRYENGLVIILPGIEGKSIFNRNLAVGLDEGGVRAAIEVFDWTTGVPGAFVYNLADIERNRREARRIAQRVERYAASHPDGPVHLIGHSGGGGIAVLALEAMKPGMQVDSVILLAPALSPEYDLSAALPHTRTAIYNFYSGRDVSALKVGTTVFGAVDREHGAAAGAVGFSKPPDAAKPLYAQKLRQVRWTENLERYGATGSHLGWTSREFAREYLSRMILLADFDYPRATSTAEPEPEPEPDNNPLDPPADE